MINTNEQNSNNLKDKKIEITNQILLKMSDIAKMKTAIKTLESMDNSILPDKDERLKQKRNELIIATVELEELRDNSKEVQSEIKNETTSANKNRVIESINHFIETNPSAAYIRETNTYYYIRDETDVSRKHNVIEIVEDPPRFMNTLATEYKISIRELNQADVFDEFVKADRSFARRRYSVDSSIWKKDSNYLPFKHMEAFFIDKVKVNDVDPAVIACFDQLLYSLSGGKAENKTHLEKWIVNKVVNYKKAAVTPELIVVGHVGGNGKGVFQNIMKQMFPASLSGPANTKTLTSNFNAILEGKLLVLFDDQDSKKIPLDLVKQLAGATEMIIEGKGENQRTIEKTFTSAWFSNDMPFELNPGGGNGGIDRRFSVMRTNITFLESIRKHAKDQGVELNEDECQNLASEMITNIFYNREYVAQWFKYLQAKHSEINEDFVLRALHGADYKYFIDKQSNSFDVVWRDLVVPSITKGQVVPLFVIKEAMRHLDGTENAVDNNVVTNAINKKIEIEGNFELTKKVTVALLSGNRSGKKQCGVVRQKNKKYTEITFDWTQVSKKPYEAVKDYEQLITEDNFVFNIDASMAEIASPAVANNQQLSKVDRILASRGIMNFEDADE